MRSTNPKHYYYYYYYYYLALSSGCSHADIHPKGASHNKLPGVPWGHTPGS